MKTNFDVLIIGAGIAGLSQAIALTEKVVSLSIAIVSKSALKETNTRYAQGGIAAVMSTQSDSYLAHIEDTLNASQHKADKEVVSFVVENAHKGIHQLENWGVRFDQVQNDYHLGLEGGHSQARILHVKDQTGAAVHDELIKQLEHHNTISVLEYCEVVELLLNANGEAAGAWIYNYAEKATTKINSKTIVLATGGMGQLFQYTTNSPIATGDGIVLASTLGAKIANLHSIQFHPTAFRELGKSKLFLISEAVRGAGAHIINEKGERFLFKYDLRGELATRDVISSAIYQEIKTSGNDGVYLDCRHISKELLAHEFPYIIENCKEGGYDLTIQPIPITPAAHYSCGGIQVNMQGESSIPNLYAIGECANTGLHGNNRLASNSLLEAIVFTRNVANHIQNNVANLVYHPTETAKQTELSNEEPDFFKAETDVLKALLTAYFISKSENDKADLIEMVTYFKEQLSNIYSNELSELHFRWKLELVEMLLQNDSLNVEVSPVDEHKLQW
ncbi:L-aspartate oxidase [Brumimicrobium oceani]|uniref:L-aspartate oxidase n=1 Tax=Brumimicrobium oceani TaxID=2100725 RepID=A0A2U2XA59_9FLAO|nr:L-aspartate oxidase [Brumimicrobium oceani]PWH84684.1 L-aspartate oxidase [Brumimicrobium oceani]